MEATDLADYEGTMHVSESEDNKDGIYTDFVLTL